MSLKNSKGVKRLITSVIATLAFIATFIPELHPIVELLRNLAGGLGAVAVTHAVASGTSKNYVSGTIASGLSALMAIFAHISATIPFVAAIYWIAGLVGAYAVGEGVRKKT